MAVLLWLSPALARPDSRVHSYALVIGSNRGGDGQGQLAFAGKDADNVAAVLRELGRTPGDHIEQLKDPTPEQVSQALTKLRTQLEAHAAAGERAQLLFYYSGHARASSLSLGARELPLSELRASLLALPSTLTVVVLDACQSGAFSGVKGAAASADFSVQSVQDLNSTGIAVMASSTGSELSQESSDLGSSYFTHHLLASLRGAGDRDRNGRVSLDEAYAYAYQNTLADTARTQVGSQHATLETALTGRGDVPLSYPVDADAQLAFSGDISGKILVQQAGRGAVMAELVKAPGVPMLIALPSGQYEVLVRGKTSARSCEVSLVRGQVASIVLGQCAEVQLPEERAKSEDRKREADLLSLESWFFEAGLAMTLPRKDAYMRRLEQFGMSDPSPLGFGFDAAGGWMLNRYLGVVGRYGVLEQSELHDNRPNDYDEVLWWTRAVTVGVRGRYPLRGRHLVLFGEAGAGLAFTRSRYSYGDVTGTRSRSRDAYGKDYNVALRALAGLEIAITRHFGFYGAAGYAFAPTQENELGDRHLGGSWNFLGGLRINGVPGGW